MIERLVLANLGMLDDKLGLRPQLAEAVPTVENGLWKLAPDGTMETTWKIKPGARWHDGIPVTAEDFLFGLQVVRDRDLAVFRDSSYDAIIGAEAPAPDVVTVVWKEPFINADALFAVVGWPFPKHLLEETLANDKANFLSVPYWNEEYVGTGAYKLKEFVRGERVVVTANDAYVLGRPKVDEIEIRFILDTNVIAANLMSGAVDLNLGRGFPLSKGHEFRSQWQDGSVLVGGGYSRIHMEPQHLNPNPPIVGDPRFRKALVHGLDRQQMADTLQYGLVGVADSLLGPDQPQYNDTIASVVKHEFDLRRASQLLEELGYRRGGEGRLADQSGQPLAVELRGQQDPINSQTTFAVAEHWKRLGIEVNLVIVSPTGTQDREYREYLATFPAFQVRRNSASVSVFQFLISRNAQLPSNNFVGFNYSRHMNPEFDAGVAKFFATIDWPQRMAALRPLLHYASDQLILMSVYYDTPATIVSNRIKGVTAASQGWNAHEWDS